MNARREARSWLRQPLCGAEGSRAARRHRSRRVVHSASRFVSGGRGSTRIPPLLGAAGSECQPGESSPELLSRRRPGAHRVLAGIAVTEKSTGSRFPRRKSRSKDSRNGLNSATRALAQRTPSVTCYQSQRQFASWASAIQRLEARLDAARSQKSLERREFDRTQREGRDRRRLDQLEAARTLDPLVQAMGLHRTAQAIYFRALGLLAKRDGPGTLAARRKTRRTATATNPGPAIALESRHG